MYKIILDTNALINVIKQKIDLVQKIDNLLQKPFELYTFDSVINELEKLSKKKSKSSAFASIALKSISEYDIKIIKGNYKNADKDIINFADTNWIVFTNDRKLKSILEKKGIRVIFIRELKKIEG
ncbi:MAG: hypothetical protein QXJ06_05165 [Candidatus Aenigmatarchaeota archaeon]|nr:hypothetical protein [Candidatus Aenigmarchaeota archaeon]